MAEGGTLAEESISSIRTVQAFGSQKKLSMLYDGHITSSFFADMKGALWQGGGMGVFFFVIYSAYALGAFFPSREKNRPILNTLS